MLEIGFDELVVLGGDLGAVGKARDVVVDIPGPVLVEDIEERDEFLVDADRRGVGARLRGPRDDDGADVPQRT
jgi:hypothetical protein